MRTNFQNIEEEIFIFLLLKNLFNLFEEFCLEVYQ